MTALLTIPRDQAALLYLPISDSTVERVLDASTQWEQIFDGITVPELSSLWVLTKLSSLRSTDTEGVERRLAQVIDLLNQDAAQSGLDSLRTGSLEQLNRAAIEAGYRRLPEYRIELLDERVVTQGDYLTASGDWDFQFCTRYRESIRAERLSTPVGEHQCLLSAEQSRIFRELTVQADEHIQIQGYAGTGKTLLIKALCSMFEHSHARILVIAERWNQLEALGVLKKRTGRVRACTFGGLARLVIPDDEDSYVNQTMLRKSTKTPTQSDEELIRYLGVQATAAHDVRQIIIAVRSTLFRFCVSADSTISTAHIPAYHARRFSTDMQAVIAEHARQLWQAYIEPGSREFQPVVRDNHRIKWAALNGWTIPRAFTHVLVDECHDLPKPIDQILQASPQARTILGDDYQALSGRFAPRSATSRQRNMVCSVRTGKTLEAIVNPIIEHHPSPMKVPFVGNAMARLKITYYTKAEIPDTPAVIVCSDTWALFEWIQRLSLTGQRIKLLSDPDFLTLFVYNCIDLKAGEQGPRHPELFRYRTWDQLANAQQGRRGFRSIGHMLDKGYCRDDWHRASLAFDREGEVRYCLGRTDDVRNLEFDTVMLTPDILDDAANKSKAAAKSMIYVAVTRARKQLILPESIREWIEEISCVNQ